MSKIVNNPKPHILDLTKRDLFELLNSWDEPPFREQQIWNGLYQQFWLDPSRFSNLPQSLRIRLSEYFEFSHLRPQKVYQSQDGKTVKVLFSLEDDAQLEAVLMYYEKRQTLCISTQSGCAMGCVFCATGQMGFYKNLSPGEIIEQVIYFASILQEKTLLVTNIVFMGMGEPFLNYDSVMAAITTMNDKSGMNFGSRRFTISTVGIVPEIARFTRENSQINLAISLHAANNTLRNSLVPINKKYPLETLIPACWDYTNATNRRITFEWALIEGINDSEQDSKELAALIKGMLCHINIIPLNPTETFQRRQTSFACALDFQKVLQQRGIPCTLRQRRGIDIHAGCGQLAAIAQKSHQKPT